MDLGSKGEGFWAENGAVGAVIKNLAEAIDRTVMRAFRG